MVSEPQKVVSVKPLLALLLLATPTAAQQPLFDRLNVTQDVSVAIEAVPADSVVAFCATKWRRDEEEKAIYVVEMRPAERPVAPLCKSSEVPLLIRPSCVFHLFEYATWRPPYVVILCRPNAFGIPLRRSGAATDLP